MWKYISRLKLKSSHDSFFLKHLSKDGLDYSNSIDNQSFQREIKLIFRAYLSQEFNSKKGKFFLNKKLRNN